MSFIHDYNAPRHGDDLPDDVDPSVAAGYAEPGDYGNCAFRSPDRQDTHLAERYWHGAPICHTCWRWEKLDGPAARHWDRTMHEALAQLDPYDQGDYLPAALGSTEDADKLIQLMVRLRDYANAQNAIMERRETTRQVDLSKGTDR